MSEHRDERRHEPHLAQMDDAGALSAPRTHVLIVDDEAVNRTLCAGYCDLFDHVSETAESGAEALSAVKSGRFDVVVLNVHMPDLSALEAVRAIRQLPAPAAATPIIGLAAPGRAHEAQRWLAAGVTGLVERPVTASRFFAAIRSVLDSESPGPRSWAPARA